MSIKKRIVGVVGLGHVGAHVAYNLGMMGVADEVKLCDKNTDKVVSECNDLMDAAYFMPHRVVYKVVDYAGLADCDVIVNAIGKIELLATLNRDSEMENSVREVAGFVDKIMAGGFNGIFVNITNPCDVITDLVQKLSGLPRNRVFGTGTGLDSSRLISAISQQTNLEHHSFTAFMIGEHGNAQMVPWSLISFYGKPLSELAGDPRFDFDREEMTKRVINGAWTTFKGKQCTEYGVAATGATVVRSILHDEKKIMPVSAYLDGEYGETGIYCGIPAVVGANGIEQVMEYTLNKDEKTEFKRCCDAIRGNIAKAEQFWKK